MKKFFLIAILFMAASFLEAEETINPEIIVKDAQDLTKLKGMEGISTLTIIDGKGNQRIRKIATVTKLYDEGKTEKKLMKFISPADVKDTGLLTFDYEKKDDDRWLYMPALRKTRRIISSEKSKNFMGSEFSYADMSYPDINEFSYKLIGKEIIKGEQCWVIEIKPKTSDIADENGFSKKTAYYSVKDKIIRKSIYYDLDGSLHKELETKEIQKIEGSSGQYKIMHMVMINKQNGRVSDMKIDKIKYNEKIEDKYFTTGYLEKK